MGRRPSTEMGLLNALGVFKIAAKSTHLVAAERRSVVQPPAHYGVLPAKQLHELSDRHPTRIAVRIHDEIGADAGLVEGHVLLLDDDAAHALLSVPTAELVTEFGASKREGVKEFAWTE